MAIVLGTSSGFVIVAPTADPAGSDTTIDGSSVVTKHTAPAGETITITEIGWYRGAGTNTANFEIALYSESAGVADVRLQVDATNSSSVQGWVITAVSWTITAGTAYWLAVQMDAHTGSSSIDSSTTGGVGSDVLTSQTTLNNPYGGGAVAQAAGMYAVYAKLSIVRNVTAGVGALTLTGFAPTVVASDNKNVLADVGALTLSGFAPAVSVTNNKNVTADVGSLTITGFAPTVSVSNNKNITPDVGSLTITGFSPTVETPRNITASTGELTIVGFAPTVTVSDHKNIAAGLGELTLTGFAPTVTVGNVQGVNPDTGQLTLIGFAPTIETPLNVRADFGEMVLEGFAPTVEVSSSGTLIETDTGLFIIEGFAPEATVTTTPRRLPRVIDVMLYNRPGRIF